MGTVFVWIRNFYAANRQPINLFLLFNGVCLLLLFLGNNLIYQKQGAYPYLATLQQWDATVWYEPMALHGYFTFQATAFFPLYVLILAAAIRIIPTYIVAAFVLNECFLLAMLLVFARLLKTLRFTDDTLKTTLLLFLFFPFSFFLFVPYTESLFLFLVLLTFYLLETKRFFWAAIVIGISTALRVPSLVLIPVYIGFIVGEYVFSREFLRDLATDLKGAARKLLLHKAYLYLPLTIVGIALYLLFLKIQFHDPLIFVKAEQYGWGNQFTLKNILSEIKFLPTHLNVIDIGAEKDRNAVFVQTIHYLNLLAVLAPLASIPWLWKRVHKAYSLFLILYFIGVVGSQNRFGGASLGRYAIIMFPLFLFLGNLATKYKIVEYILIPFAGLFAFLFILFTHGYMIV